VNNKDFFDQALLAALSAIIQSSPTFSPFEAATAAVAYADELCELREKRLGEEGEMQ
jgi:hypothetical protein